MTEENAEVNETNETNEVPVANTDSTEETLNAPETKDEVSGDPAEKEVVEEEVEEEVEEDDEDCFFVTEDDTFEVTIRYKKVNGDIVVDGIDTDFVEEVPEDTEEETEEDRLTKNAKIKEIKMTIKDISHGDCDIIGNSARMKGISGDADFSVREYNILECVRFAVLVRSWTLKTELTEENVFALNPKIVRSVLNGIRARMGSEGIL